MVPINFIDHCIDEPKALPRFGYQLTLIGSYLVNDQPAGISVREDQSSITQDSARFPLVFCQRNPELPPWPPFIEKFGGERATIAPDPALDHGVAGKAWVKLALR